jgi:LmbE family N-acetylglucosaminyl deacetylase
VLDIQPRRVLAIYAHPNDVEPACGGALARWVASGADAQVILVAQGDKGLGPRDSFDGCELAEVRAREAAAAAAQLGIPTPENLGYRDGEFENDLDLRREIVARIRKFKPDTVITPDPMAVFFGGTYFNHRDHRVTGWAALDSVSPAAGSARYFPSSGPPHAVDLVLMSGTQEPDTFVDIAGYLEAKIAAIRCHATQVNSGDDHPDWVVVTVEQRARRTGQLAGLILAEGFKKLRLSGPG